LLAWADVETGHTPEAAALLRSNPPLSDVGLTWSTPLYFPRIFCLRTVVAEKQGKSEEARENWRIFYALSRSDPLMWGEEQKGKRREAGSEIQTCSGTAAEAVMTEYVYDANGAWWQNTISCSSGQSGATRNPPVGTPYLTADMLGSARLSRPIRMRLANETVFTYGFCRV